MFKLQNRCRSSGNDRTKETNDYAVAKEHRSGFANKAIDSAVKGAKEALETELNKANEDVKELALK
jgi:hypothetical protein